MTQTVCDTPVALLTEELFKLVAECSRSDYIGIQSDIDGSWTKYSSYDFLKKLATDPAMQGDAWKQALDYAGITAGTIMGYGVLAVATGPLAPFTALAAVMAAPFFGSSRLSTIIVCNGTKGDMVLSGTFQDCGVQTARPVYSAIDPDTHLAISALADVVPGETEILPGLKQFGVGMYRFEKNLDLGIGFYGTGGAISWTFKDPAVTTTMAMAWLVPQSGKYGFAVTDDLSKYGSVKDFYYATADQRDKNYITSAGSAPGPQIMTRAYSRTAPDHPNNDDLSFTVWIKS